MSEFIELISGPEVHLDSLSPGRVGAKAHNLGRMLSLGLSVPTGFVITTDAFKAFVAHNDLNDFIERRCESIDLANAESLRTVAQDIRERILAAVIPRGVWIAIAKTRRELLGVGPWIVRSSAVGEDGASDSFAGQLDSVIDVRSATAMRKALLQCWASYWSERSLFYQRARGVRLAGMGVVIQQMVEPALAGVLFTRAPDDAAAMLLEYCHGHGEALVGGQINPGRVAIDRQSFAQTALAAAEGEDTCVLGSQERTSLFDSLAKTAARLEEALAAPQDIEWAADASGVLHFVQTRPITTGGSAQTDGSAQSGDDNQPRARVLWSNANINENYPEPVTPMLHSVAREAYEHYFRGLGFAFGVSGRRIRAIEYPLRNLIGAHGGRLYYNLTNIHACLSAAPFGELLTDYFNTFVGVESDTRTSGLSTADAHGIEPRSHTSVEVGRMVLTTLRSLRALPRRISEFERRVEDFASGCAIPAVEKASLQELLILFRQFLDIRFNHWTDAALGDAASSLSFGLLKTLLKDPMLDESAHQLARKLLEGGPRVISCQPILGLWDLSRKARQDVELREIFASESSEAILAVVRIPGRFDTFEVALDDYLERWGYRVSGELLLTVPSLQEEPGSLIDMLRTYVSMEGPAPSEVMRRQRDDIDSLVRKLARRLSGAKIAGMPFLRKSQLLEPVVEWTHKSIAFRERARLKQSLLYNRFRRVLLMMGTRLVERGFFLDREDIFYLTYQELDSLVSGNSMYAKATQSLVELRRAEHGRVSKLRPPDSVSLPEGDYFAASPTFVSHGEEAEEAGDHLRGVGACSGRVKATARVLRDLTESHRLRAGELLVTRQTDPGWGPLFFLAGGLVMERGGLLSHGAIVAREFGIPAVVDIQNATDLIADGSVLDVDGDAGVVMVVEDVEDDGPSGKRLAAS